MKIIDDDIVMLSTAKHPGLAILILWPGFLLPLVVRMTIKASIVMLSKAKYPG